ncbi:hypothetical protein M404DRAFT_1008796 [Pisolithus tinctorius Marx 270]|uniref:Uncharacterized protein n=1 Tax=Pisolithus tinctorius Marx 270 TaxID=870435 RepID=A0A0C3J7J3_PISTI|nr:hypothetical protein M404DRAFT_1008796 [Pisolithus tinctorius Marx 270]
MSTTPPPIRCAHSMSDARIDLFERSLRNRAIESNATVRLLMKAGSESMRTSWWLPDTLFVAAASLRFHQLLIVLRV